MDDVTRGKTMALGELGFPGFASVEGSAFLQKLRSRRSMNGPVHATSAEQRLVGRVHDGVHFQFREVVHSNFQFLPHGFVPSWLFF